MQVLFVVSLLFSVVSGCSVAGPLPTFDELFAQTEFVVSGKIIQGRGFELECPEKGRAIFQTPVTTTIVDDYGNEIIIGTTFDFEPNATFVVQVSCVQKGTITCYTPANDGYKVADAGSVLNEECWVYVHSVDTVTSCGFFGGPSDTELTFLLKSDGLVSKDAVNKQCYDSTFALENYVYDAINRFVPETCPYQAPPLPDCPRTECFDVMSKACCDIDFDCSVPNLSLDYKYLGRCGQEGKRYFERKDSVVGQCVCN